MASVKRRGQRVRVRLEPEERMILGGFAREVAGLLGGATDAPADPLEALVESASTAVAPDDPALRRLLPDAYADAAGAQEFRRLTEADLRQGKATMLVRLADDVEHAGDPIELSAEQADGWLQAVNDIRLVLGVRLDVSDDDGDWRDDLRPGDPRLPLTAAYDWLSWLQEMLVAAVLPR